MDGSKTVEPASAFASPTFEKDWSFEVDKPVGSASISPCGRDVVLASRYGLDIIDLDSPWDPPRHLPHHTPWEVADVQWSPFPSRDYWVVSTSNQKALVWNLGLSSPKASIQHVLHAHSRAITDINFSAHHPDVLATCAVDGFVHCWDLRHPARPALTFCDWFAGATQVKWNRQDSHVVASSHDKYLKIWDDRKGAYPLRYIEAHDTKIYGLDWNRIRATHVVTCSLDKTIKFWDTLKEDDEPDRIIRTAFPVWRARHTPFGWGMLAMPQRGDNNLHLYDRRVAEGTPLDYAAPPAHRFEGHKNHVKEFLWRPRGTIDSNADGRDFQLVSWGADRILRLHHVDSGILAGVGHEKGIKPPGNIIVTRKNVTYKTFREDPLEPGSKIAKGTNVSQLSETLHQRLRQPEGPKHTTRKDTTPKTHPVSGEWERGGFLSSKPGMHNRAAAARKDIDPISWMKGVKIGKCESGMDHTMASISSPSFRADRNWDDFDSLGEEITDVGAKFSKIHFYKVDVQNRFVKISMNGPWGANDTLTHLDCRLDFPTMYPTESIPSFSAEKTASIAEDVVTKLTADVHTIGRAYLAYQRGSLEALTRYLQGEQALDDILGWTKAEPENSALLDFAENDDSDEEDEGDAYKAVQADDFGLGGSGMLNSSNANANVPLPKACGALWADNGLLICFFPPKEDRVQSLVDVLGLDTALQAKGKKGVFEGFGRLQAPAVRSKLFRADGTGVSGETDSESGSEASDLSSANSTTNSNAFSHGRRQMNSQYIFPTDLLRISQGGIGLDETHRSNGSVSISRSGFTQSKNVVSIHDLSSMLPSKKKLAQFYKLSGPNACKHNASVAADEGLQDLANAWSLLDMIIRDEVPVETMPTKEGQVQILVVARRASSCLHRNDSGIDVMFDTGARSHGKKAKYSVKWGEHPLGSSYLIKELFAHFEQLADVQMLAMMCCILQPSTQSLFPHAPDPRRFPSNLSRSNQLLCSHLPMHEESDLLSNSYFPSSEVARSYDYAAPPTLSVSNGMGKMKIEPPSLASSFGASISDPMTPFSTGAASPSNYIQSKRYREGSDSAHQPLSTSPERFRYNQRSNSNLSASFRASLPRPLSFSASASSSPPQLFTKRSISPAGSFVGNIAPNANWNLVGTFSRSMSTTEEPKSMPASFEIHPDEHLVLDQEQTYGIRLKNQSQFHNEGYANISLLSEDHTSQYHVYITAYADMLATWVLLIAKCEILKFNSGWAALDPMLRLQQERNLSSIHIGREPARRVRPAPSNTLEMRRTCSSCNEAMASDPSSKCESCKSRRTPVGCALCAEPAYGAIKPCPCCGHALHSGCRSLMSSLGGGEGGEDGWCVFGCNCHCIVHISIDVEWPEEALPRPPSAPSTIREPEEHDSEDWLHGRDGWEDVAYESLAKNLRAPGARPLQPKTSSIWRGE